MILTTALGTVRPRCAFDQKMSLYPFPGGFEFFSALQLKSPDLESFSGFKEVSKSSALR